MPIKIIKIINGIKYIELFDSNELKNKSLEDNVYYTLKDIIYNGEEDDIAASNYLIKNLKKTDTNVNYQEYSNILYDYNSDFTQKLYNYMCKFSITKINLIEENVQKLNSDKKYIKLDEWIIQFNNLTQKINEQLKKHKVWESDDIDDDIDKLDEISYN